MNLVNAFFKNTVSFIAFFGIFEIGHFFRTVSKSKSSTYYRTEIVIFTENLYKLFQTRTKLKGSNSGVGRVAINRALLVSEPQTSDQGYIEKHTQRIHHHHINNEEEAFPKCITD